MQFHDAPIPRTWLLTESHQRPTCLVRVRPMDETDDPIIAESPLIQGASR